MRIIDYPARVALCGVLLACFLISTASTAVAQTNGPSVLAKHVSRTCFKHPARGVRKHCVGGSARSLLRRSSDRTAPSVSWKVPVAGSAIKGKIQGSVCEVAASDNRGVDSVVFRVDGTPLNTESGTPWNCIFDSTQVADGSHTLTATAYDLAGNSRSASLSVVVSNTVATAPAPSPEPTPAPDPEPIPAPEPSPQPTAMTVGLDAGNYGTSGAADVRGAVNTVRYETELGVSALENFKKAGLRIQMNFSGPYNSGGVCALNATAWVAEALAFYKANTTPTQTPTVEVLNEPGGTWFWGSSAASSTSAACYRDLLKKTHAAFHGQYGSSAPKILGTLDGSGGFAFGKAWVTSDWATYVDGFIVHPYGGTGSRTSSALGNRARVEDAHAMTGGPIYITEVGWPTATSQSSTSDSLQWSESEQAANITGFIGWAASTGYVAEVVYFNYHDFGARDWYGVVRSDGSHKPSYEALRQAALKYGA
jgi:Big-like domain-containing protein/putative glycosyl hydrolase